MLFFQLKMKIQRFAERTPNSTTEAMAFPQKISNKNR